MSQKIKRGDIIDVKITGIQPYGAFASLPDNSTGLIHISEISDKFVKSIDSFVKVGESIKVKVIDFDQETNHAKLSLKAIDNRYRRRNKRVYYKNPRRLIVETPNGFKPLALAMENGLNKESRRKVKMITLDLSKAKLSEDLESYKDKVKEIHDMIHNKTGAGNDFLGWVELPENYDKAEVELIKETAASLREKTDVLLVCGIGGSYLGARAAIEAINGLYPTNDVEIIYVGNTFSSNYIKQVADYIKDKDFAINVISKSGTTTETSIAFRIFKEMCETKYGKVGAKERIVATTDKAKGALKTLATEEGYTTFVIPDDVGGRYSVLTPVGLFPIAMAGIDVDAMLKGAKDAMEKYGNADLDQMMLINMVLLARFYTKPDTLLKCL